MKALKQVASYSLFIFMYILGFYVFKLLNKVEIIGKKNLPRRTKILYIANHRTYIDSMLVGIGVINLYELFFAQRRIPWNAPDQKNFYTNKFGVVFMKLLKNIPVKREAICRGLLENLIDKYCKTLEKENLLLFPEGGRTKNGQNEMEEFKSGVAKTILAKTKNDPNFLVVPIYLSKGVEAIMPRFVGQKYLKIKSGKRGFVIIGEPIDFKEICLNGKSENEILDLIKEKGKNAILFLKEKSNREIIN